MTVLANVTDTGRTSIDHLAAVVASLSKTLAEAKEAEWEKPAIPRPSLDTSERAKGVLSDPTPEIALDTLRWKLRAQVAEAERVVEQVTVVLEHVRRRVDDRLGAWEGVA